MDTKKKSISTPIKIYMKMGIPTKYKLKARMDMEKWDHLTMRRNNSRNNHRNKIWDTISFLIFLLNLKKLKRIQGRFLLKYQSLRLQDIPLRNLWSILSQRQTVQISTLVPVPQCMRKPRAKSKDTSSKPQKDPLTFPPLRRIKISNVGNVMDSIVRLVGPLCLHSIDLLGVKMKMTTVSV